MGMGPTTVYSHTCTHGLPLCPQSHASIIATRAAAPSTGPEVLMGAPYPCARVLVNVVVLVAPEAVGFDVVVLRSFERVLITDD